MDTIRTSVRRLLGNGAFSRIRSGAFPSLVYAGSLDVLELSLIAFAILATIEAVLPGIISVRMNLAVPLVAILLLATFCAALGKATGAAFPFAPDKRSPVTWIGISWLAFLLTLSSIKFPPILVPVIVGAFFYALRLFWRVLFREE